MFSHVQLRDFKPDVVICPHCTQHLMGVKDVQWTADRVSFTYGCAGCGHEIDRPVGEDVIPAARVAAPEPHKPASDDVTVMEDFPFPFRKSREAPLFALKADDAGPTDNLIAANDPADDDDDDNEMTEHHDAPAPFGSMRLLPPKPSWMETPVFGRERPALTPKQVFDTERRDSERRDGPPPDSAATTRASALLRDVSIFSL
ncbi:hypothetical protein AFIC_001864 [[Pseudomonas] carboxydohydrogena]|uniref:Uncharacterized protein n=1 Tax=Afipia carboxydohydrogena TaxID=290 RepID=A0ABY8BKA2_AFICR|nr:hypothetical protein [[Pseudomonas] carboxydohydrogena]WEF50328.1 hypothetical protein AFIC_001864 [[Pseudomonas] carboxydohydrogena]